MKALLDPTAAVIIGQRIHSILYGGRDGIVYAIEGDQCPDSIRSLGGGVVMTGGNAYFKIVFEDGTLSHVPESIARGVQWRIYSETASNEEIEAALRFADAEKIRREEEDRLGTEAREARKAKAIADNPHLAVVAKGDYPSAKLGAKNIRTELKRAFPGHRFSVTSSLFSGGDSIDIRWSLGPTTEEVQSITAKYQEGHFNGMEDIYEDDRENVWPGVFGGAKYVHSQRETGEEHRAVAEALCRYYDLPIPEDDIFWRIRIPNHHEDIGCLARQIILAHSYPAGAVVTGCIHKEGITAGHLREFFTVTYTAPGHPATQPEVTQPATKPASDPIESVLADFR